MTQYPVLVYGTLRPTGHNYENFLGGFTTYEENVTVDGFTMFAGEGYPYLTLGERSITATLCYVDEAAYDFVVKRLDFLEGFRGENVRSNHYDRILHTFTLRGETVQAWIYVASAGVQADVERSLFILESGDWIEHVLERDSVHA